MLQVFAYTNAAKTKRIHMEYYKVMRINTLQPNNMSDSHKQKIDWKKADTEEHRLYNALIDAI